MSNMDLWRGKGGWKLEKGKKKDGERKGVGDQGRKYGRKWGFGWRCGDVDGEGKRKERGMEEPGKKETTGK